MIVKMTSKKEKNQRFQIEKRTNHFAEGLMVSTYAWKSFIEVFIAIFHLKIANLSSKIKIYHFCHQNILDPNPDPEYGSVLRSMLIRNTEQRQTEIARMLLIRIYPETKAKTHFMLWIQIHRGKRRIKRISTTLEKYDKVWVRFTKPNHKRP